MKSNYLTQLLHLFCIIMVFFAPQAMAEQLRTSPDNLKQRLGTKNLVIVDARSPEAYQAGHIQGAVNFPVNLTYADKKISGKLVRPKQMQQYLRERGISLKSKVVIYDDGALVDAARVFWSLEVYGLSQVQVLDHGYDYWTSKAYPTDFEVPAITPSKYVVQINNKRLASKFSTQLAILNNNKIIVDARDNPAYKGKTSVAKRFGHIPSAINIPASHNFATENGVAALKSLEQTKALYSGIPKDKKVVIYCAIGRISSANYLALRELGYDVANYDASWKEWGNDFKLPIEK